MAKSGYIKTNNQLMVETDYCELVVHNTGKTNYTPKEKYDRATKSWHPNPEYKS